MYVTSCLHTAQSCICSPDRILHPILSYTFLDISPTFIVPLIFSFQMLHDLLTQYPFYCMRQFIVSYNNSFRILRSLPMRCSASAMFASSNVDSCQARTSQHCDKPSALLVILVIFTCSTFYVCIAFSMDPLRFEIKLYYYYYLQPCQHLLTQLTSFNG